VANILITVTSSETRGKNKAGTETSDSGNVLSAFSAHLGTVIQRFDDRQDEISTAKTHGVLCPPQITHIDCPGLQPG